MFSVEWYEMRGNVNMCKEKADSEVATALNTRNVLEEYLAWEIITYFKKVLDKTKQFVPCDKIIIRHSLSK